MAARTKSYLLVVVQFSVLGLIGLTGPLVASHLALLAMELAGVGLGFWAIGVMRPWNFNITPDVKVDGYMVARGPYAMIRHPMYAALLLVSAALVADSFLWWRGVLFLVLLADILIKLRYEESLLSAHYPEYRAYAAKTKRLVPFVY